MVKSRNEISLEQYYVQNAEREENYFGDSSSVCSEEASNCPEDEEFVSNFNKTFERRRRKSSKKYQVARKSKLLKEKETKLDKKMRILQQLIPNSNNNVDKDCVLDEAIVYIKNLQNQLQFILSANALLSYGMYSWRMQANMTQQLYASSIVHNDTFSRSPISSLVGSRNEMPSSSGMFIQHPLSLISNSNMSFSPYGSFMMPFQST